MEDKCQKCSEKLIYEGQKFCINCGWNLSKPIPKQPAVIEERPFCRFCNHRLPRSFWINICPNCGKYLAANADEIHPKLVETARNWLGNTSKFCSDELRLSQRVTNALARSKLGPIEIIAYDQNRLLAVRNFGQEAYKELENARINWHPRNDVDQE